MPFFYMDYWYLILVVPTLIIAVIAQIRVSSAFRTYQMYESRIGLTAAEVTRKILDQNGLFSVRVERVSGHLTDHFDPRNGVIRLSDSVDSSRSIAAIGVAAHEAGHAVQHAQHYAPIVVRNRLVPVANLGCNLAPMLIVFGLLLSMQPLVLVGVVLYSSIAVFQLVTLPVEFNASGRALKTLSQLQVLDAEELSGARQVLSAAAMTYVAALLTTLANLLRFIMISRRNDD